MIKKIVLLVLALASLYGAFLSPYSLSTTMEKKSQLESAISSQTAAKNERDMARIALNNAVTAFESERTFDIHYTDITRMKQLIDSVTGVSFAGMYEADPKANYMLGGQLLIEDYLDGTAQLPQAVALSLIAEDTAAGLRIVDKLELPAVRITTSEPGRIDIIFLTGGVN